MKTKNSQHKLIKIIGPGEVVYYNGIDYKSKTVTNCSLCKGTGKLFAGNSYYRCPQCNGKKVITKSHFVPTVKKCVVEDVVVKKNGHIHYTVAYDGNSFSCLSEKLFLTKTDAEKSHDTLKDFLESMNKDRKNGPKRRLENAGKRKRTKIRKPVAAK